MEYWLKSLLKDWELDKDILDEKVIPPAACVTAEFIMLAP